MIILIIEVRKKKEDVLDAIELILPQGIFLSFFFLSARCQLIFL